METNNNTSHAKVTTEIPSNETITVVNDIIPEKPHMTLVTANVPIDTLVVIFVTFWANMADDENLDTG